MPGGRGAVTGGTTIAAIWKSAVALIACLAVIDVIGVVACVWFDIKPFGGNSAALPYAIWFVGGIFAGVFTVILTGRWIATNDGWMDRPEAPGIATRVLLTCTPILAGLSFFFWRIYWSQGGGGGVFRAGFDVAHAHLFSLCVRGPGRRSDRAGAEAGGARLMAFTRTQVGVAAGP